MLSINDIGKLIKNNIPKDRLILKAEVRQPKLYASGHLYLTLKDSCGTISAMIWKNNVTDNIKNLTDGDIIEATGKLDYYIPNGNLNFIISSVKSKNEEGDLYKLEKHIYEKFMKKGYFLPEKKLKVGNYIKNILLLTSKNGDAIKDFYHCIEHNNMLINDTFKSVAVQGVDCPKDICSILQKSDLSNYDLIVITRGGGSREDLFGFCQPELIEVIHKINTPVLSAIGHRNDTTLIDHVADYVAATPSLAAQFIVNHNKEYLNSIEIRKNLLIDLLKKDVIDRINKLHDLDRTVNNQQLYFERIKTSCKNNIIEEINKRLLQLSRLDNTYKIENNIKLFIKNKELRNEMDLDLLQKSKTLTIQWNETIVTLKLS